jgi:5-formyltetrahydrofolate cyclo-ligase
MPAPPTKRDLRDRLRGVRRTIAAEPVERATRSDRIWAQVVTLLPVGTGRIMMFESLPAEPDTARWIDWCRERNIEVFVPRVDGRDLHVEPGDLDPARLDVVIVPGLGFTPDGRRLGQGGGHYDRFLGRLPPDTRTIGVGFAEQLLDDLPTEPHDHRVHHVITA